MVKIAHPNIFFRSIYMLFDSADVITTQLAMILNVNISAEKSNYQLKWLTKNLIVTVNEEFHKSVFDTKIVDILKVHNNRSMSDWLYFCWETGKEFKISSTITLIHVWLYFWQLTFNKSALEFPNCLDYGTR